MEKIVVNDITLGQEVVSESAASEKYAEDQICLGRKVTLNFELSLPGGDVIDSNFSKQAATFSVGDGNLLSGFEQAIFGMKAGEENTMTIPAEQAFGQSREENIQTFPRYRFPADLAMEKGVMINFTDQGGNDQPGMIQNFNADRVEIDFNHPLAGRDIVFKVKIISVSTASD